MGGRGTGGGYLTTKQTKCERNTFAEACQGFSRRQALKNADDLFTLRLWSNSKRPSSSRVSALGCHDLSKVSDEDGGDEVKPTPLCGPAVAVALRGRGCAARWCSRFVQSRQFRTLRKHVFHVFIRVRGRGSRFAQRVNGSYGWGMILTEEKSASTTYTRLGTLQYRPPISSRACWFYAH